MSYAVETKKRKFDRILEALTDGAASPSRSSLNSRNNASSTSLSQDAASYSSKRRRVTPPANLNVSASASPMPSSLTGHYLPSSRTAFLQRLETFRHVTQWHIPSTDPINAAAWAMRGWICVDTDTVYCGACKERLFVDLSLDEKLLRAREKDDGAVDGKESVDENNDFAMSSEIYDSIVKRYQDMIVTAHADSCLWRKRGCDASIQRIEGLLNTALAISSLKTRYDSIMTRPDEVPEVEPLAASSLVDTQELELFRFGGEEQPDLNALRLAICGWERKCEDVIECLHCFRSLGLWLYRGDSPAIGKLDGVDNHLEYCPWRSADAQDTEVVLTPRRPKEETGPNKQRVSGWMLVHQAVAKDINKKKGVRPAGLATASEAESSSGTSNSDSMTPELREKRMRDLLRRIKEIKKPFNVRALLKRGDKSKA